MGRRGFHVLVGVTIHGRPALTGTMQLDRSCWLVLLLHHFPPNSIVPAWNRRNRAGDVVPEATPCWKPRISRCLDGRHELAMQMARGQHAGHRVPDVVPWVPEKASDASQQRSGASGQRLGAPEQNSRASDSRSGASGKDSDPSRQRSGASRQRSDASDRGSAAAFAVMVQWDRLCWLDLHPQELCRSLITGLVRARASITPGLAEASAAPPRPSQLHRFGQALT